MRILLLEDEAELASLVASNLKREAFAVDIAGTLTEAGQFLKTGRYDVIIADRNLPDGDGLAIGRQMLNFKLSIPLLMLTAKGLPDDRVEGLEAGADDYLIKPFAMNELLARVKALLRRPTGIAGLQLQIGNLSLDTVHGAVQVAGQVIKLTRREMVILDTLLRRSGQLVNKDVLEQTLYGMDEEGSRGAVDVAIHRLRKNLAKAKATLHIHTMRGLGYVLEEIKS